MIASTASPLRVVVLGPPASGKGTQGRRLAERFGLGYLSTGALLREEMKNGSELGNQAEPILARGGYLPDELMCPLLADWLGRQTGGWVLDGFPRSLPQAEFLDRWLADHGMTLDAAVALDVPFETLLERMRDRVECRECRWSGGQAELPPDGCCPKCGGPAGPRADDTEANFRNRHDEFSTLVLPVIERYRQRGVLFPCDATAPQDVVAERLAAPFQKCPA